jgi:hypothetical protein
MRKACIEEECIEETECTKDKASVERTHADLAFRTSHGNNALPKYSIGARRCIRHSVGRHN